MEANEDTGTVENTKEPKENPRRLTATCLPDSLLVAKDIRDQLKCVKFSTPLKLKISGCMKEVEELLRCAPEVGPYLRRALVDLRGAVKLRFNNDENVTAALHKYQQRYGRVKEKKHQIVKAQEEAKRVKIDGPPVRIFQLMVSDNIRISTMGYETDIKVAVRKARHFEQLLKEIEKLTVFHSFTTKVKGKIKRTLQVLQDLLVLDGIHALRMEHETKALKNAVEKGRTAEEEIEKRIKDMGTKLRNTSIECKTKRDEGQWLLREVCWKVMSQMDREIDRTLQNKRNKARRV